MKKLNSNPYSPIFWIVTVMILIGSCSDVIFAQSSMLIKGEPANHQGVAFWNADGSGPELAASGHRLPWKGGDELYYMATADYSGIDPQATAGMTAISIVSGFTNFAAALAANGFAISDVTFKFGLYSLGNDIEGEDWWLEGRREMRIYRSEQDLVIQLNGENLAAGPAPAIVLDIEWDAIMYSVESDTFFVEDKSGASSTAVQAVAEAFLTDITSSGLRLVRARRVLTLTNGTLITTGQGRIGFIDPTQDLMLNIVETSTGIDGEKGFEVPKSFILHQNYPNPFNPRTMITYSIPKSGFVELKIYNMLGREIQTVMNELQQAGSYSFDFDASNLSNGVYFYQLKMGNLFSETKKMLYIK